jgi:hypothetical protein
VEPEPVFTIWSDGQQAPCPVTVTLNTQFAALAEESIAVQLTVVAPIGKVEPDGGEQEEVAPGQLSVTPGTG